MKDSKYRLELKKEATMGSTVSKKILIFHLINFEICINKLRKEVEAVMGLEVCINPFLKC